MAVTINGTTGILAPDIGIDGTTLTVDAVNNRVGIGTSSPLHAHHVYGPNTVAKFQSSTNYVDLLFQNTGSTNGYIQYNNAGNFIFYANSGSTPTLTISSGAPGNVGVGGLTNPGALLSIPAGESNTPRLAIESAVDDNDFTITQYEDGNGTYTMLGQNVKLNSGGNNTILDSGHRTAGILLDARNHGAITFLTGAANAVDENVKIDSGGKVGIGVTTPTAVLDIGKVGTNGVEIRMGGSGYSTLFRYGTGEDNYITQGASGHTVFRNRENAEFMRVHSSGKVGIGVVTPSFELDLSGRFKATHGSSGLLFEEVNNGAFLWLDGANGDFSGGDYYGIAANNNQKLQIGYGGSADFVLDSSKNCGIGTSAPLTRLHVLNSKSTDPGRTKQWETLRLSLARTSGAMPYLGWGPTLDFYSDNYDSGTQRPNARIAGVVSNYSAGHDGGQIRMYTTPTDTATDESDFVEALRIDAKSNVTMPEQPSFWAYNVAGLGTQIISGRYRTVTWTNIPTNEYSSAAGNPHNNTSGRYTCPTGGVYHCFIHCGFRTTYNDWMGLFLYKNGSQIIYTWQPPGSNSTNDTYIDLHLEAYIKCAENDMIDLCYDANYSTFGASYLQNYMGIRLVG